MGANIDTQALLKKRKQILDIILKDLKSWDGTIESGVEIVEFCQANLDKIKLINQTIIKLHQRDLYDEEYEIKLNLLLKEQKKFTKALKDKQNQLLNSIQQLNKKKDVADNYISTPINPMFIDKDL